VARLNPVDARLLPTLMAGRRPAALLVEYQEPTAETLEQTGRRPAAVQSGLQLSLPPALSTDAASRNALWHLRKG
jgi:D-lactate dehydrogenase